MEQPLLSSEKSGSERWSSYEHVARAGSSIPTASLAGTEVSVDEIRSAAAFSDPYPPSLHAPLLSSPAPPYPSEQVIGYPQDAHYGHLREHAANVQRPVLDEVEIRELLIDHVGHRCCWGSRPARTWTIHTVEDCNVYVGTLETFVEESETITEKVPYLGGEVDGRGKGHEPGLWELDLRSEFPVLFTPHKELRTIIPHSEAVEKCPGCDGRGDIVCPTCNADQERGFYKANQMSQCTACHGRGLIAHKDGSDTICQKCNGKGMIPCATCGSRGLVKCEACRGGSSLLQRQVAVVRWRTLLARKVSATSGAASVPDEVFHRAKGVQLCNTQAHQCTPAYFADSYFLNKFSSEVIAERASVPPTARFICERHTISVVPVTRVTMTHQRRSFSFYIIGTSREVYLKDSYPARFCWGLCPCLEWLKL
ncbi:putative molecular chaperone, contains DnaJ domain [Handroanthus impetiginosus]|uniref:Putative molecular chaperone, contains DnaJ domain n=1 Tax=Handroanthus impetiginosus TaxID=429701 RepID=A0A2G9I535_9LAMI|nr:putative molecular chaperone, contains DnaJ domain [Handroanthus impetiginosus]